MKNLLRQILTITGIISLGLAFTGCGSGGSSTGNSAKAKTSIKTSGLTTPGTLVGVLDISISIPNGVTAPIQPGTTVGDNNLNKDLINNLVQFSSTGAVPPDNYLLPSITYLPATATQSGSLRILYIKADGFTPTDSLIVQLDITTGYFPKKADFILSKFDIATFNPTTQDLSAAIDKNNPDRITVDII